MYYSIKNTTILNAQLQKIWHYETSATLLDVTAFGDFFIQLNSGDIYLYSLTDGQIMDVTELVEEFGLPPVNLDLGDEWYQLSAQALLKEQNKALNEGQCFAFVEPLFDEETPGIYGPENIEVTTITAYHQRMQPLIGK